MCCVIRSFQVHCCSLHHSPGRSGPVCVLHLNTCCQQPLSDDSISQQSHGGTVGAGGIAFDIGFEGASEKYYQQPAGRATLTRLVMDVAAQQVC